MMLFTTPAAISGIRASSASACVFCLPRAPLTRGVLFGLLGLTAEIRPIVKPAVAVFAQTLAALFFAPRVPPRKAIEKRTNRDQKEYGDKPIHPVTLGCNLLFAKPCGKARRTLG